MEWLWALPFVVGVGIVGWIHYFFFRNPGIIDGLWAFGIVGSGIVLFHPWNRTVSDFEFAVLGLMVFWALRLSGSLLVKRIIPNRLETRYLRLAQNWSKNHLAVFFWHFQFQGLLMFLVSLPFAFLADTGTGSVWQWGLFVMMMLATLLEIVADRQLDAFVSQGGKGVFRGGLWAYSRHPNMFFDWLLWLFLSVLVVLSNLSFLALVSPLTLLWVMRITIPVSEAQSLEKRGQAYLDYQKEVSVWILRFPKS